jgi:hypothetical protein
VIAPASSEARKYTSEPTSTAAIFQISVHLNTLRIDAEPGSQTRLEPNGWRFILLTEQIDAPG